MKKIFEHLGENRFKLQSSDTEPTENVFQYYIKVQGKSPNVSNEQVKTQTEELFKYVVKMLKSMDIDAINSHMKRVTQYDHYPPQYKQNIFVLTLVIGVGMSKIPDTHHGPQLYKGLDTFDFEKEKEIGENIVKAVTRFAVSNVGKHLFRYHISVPVEYKGLSKFKWPVVIGEKTI